MLTTYRFPSFDCRQRFDLKSIQASDILYGKNVFEFSDEEGSEYADPRYVSSMFGIYSFLKDIGDRHRLRLRKINLTFMDRYFLFYEDEDWFSDPHGYPYSRARILGKALQLLAKGHALRTLGIYLCAVEEDGISERGKDFEDYPSWPAFMATKRIRQYFLDIKGINKVIIDVEDLRDEDKESIQEFKRAMENGAP